MAARRLSKGGRACVGSGVILGSTVALLFLARLFAWLSRAQIDYLAN